MTNLEKAHRNKRKRKNLEEKHTKKLRIESQKIEEEGDEEREEHIHKLQRSRSWNNLDLILYLQSKQLHLHRKIEFAFDFIESTRNKKGGDDDRSSESVTISRLIVFVNDWIQSLLISSDKKSFVVGSENSKNPTPGITEPCLDFRCWDVFYFCLQESSRSAISLSFSPNLLRAVSRVLMEALSKLDGALSCDNELFLFTEGFELYNLVSECVFLSFSSQARAINANLDVWVLSATSALYLVRKILVDNPTGSNVDNLFRLSGLVLEPFANFLRVHPSPKNVFPIFVNSLLEPFLASHVLLARSSNPSNCLWVARLLTIVEDVLSNGLFHPAHIAGFLCTKSSEKYIGSQAREQWAKELGTDIKSYHKHFFKKLEQITVEKMALAMDGFGELLHLFVIRVKKLKGASTITNGTNVTVKPELDARPKSDISAVTSRLDEEMSKSLFDIFVLFMEPLVLDVRRYSESKCSEVEESNELILSDVHCTIKSINRMLASLMHEKIYVRTEDTSEGAHHNFLKEVFNTLISFSVKIQQLWQLTLKIGDGRCIEMLRLIAKEAIATIRCFLEIEYKVVGNDLVSLWLLMLSYLAIDLSSVDTQDNCLLVSEIQHLGCQLFNVYCELRQVDSPIFALCKALRVFIFPGDDSEIEHSKFVSCTHLSSGACVQSVVTLSGSHEFRFSISTAINSIPEGQASGCIQQVKDDITESLEWVKISGLSTDATESGKTIIPISKVQELDLQAIVLGRGLSELYTLMLDSSTVTTGNSILVGNSVKDLITAIRPIMSILVQKQSDSVHKFLHKMPGCENGLTITEPGISWLLVFIFRIYISCRNLYRQSVSLMPPNLSRKFSAAMGDLFTASCGKDWIERVDWMAGGYFSWIINPSTSLLGIMQSVSDIFPQHSFKDHAALVYILFVMAFQRLVDLNRQIKAFEFLQERDARLVQIKLIDDVDSHLVHRECKRWKKLISVSRQEAADLTSSMSGYLSSIFTKGQSIFIKGNVTGECKATQSTQEGDTWDLVVCSVNEKSLATAIWWLLCQNTDIWCAHATKRNLKKFLSLLFYNSLPCVRSGFGDVGKQNMEELGCRRKVTLRHISLELLGDTVLYEQTFLCRHLTSRFCRILKKSFSNDLDFSSLPDWPEVLSILEEASVVGNTYRHALRDGYSATGMDFLSSNLLPLECHNGNEAFPIASTELKACQNLLDLFCWMPKDYANSRSFSVCATYILNLERLVVLSLLKRHSEFYLHNYYELFTLFVSCRRALKYLVMAYGEDTLEVRQSSFIPILGGSSASILWLLKSVSEVVGLSHVQSEVEHASQVKDMILSLMDHTSHIFLTLSEDQLNVAVCSYIYNLIEPDLHSYSTEHFDAWNCVKVMAETLKEQAKVLLIALAASVHDAKLKPHTSVVNWNKLSSTISCFQGFLWGTSSALNDIDNNCSMAKIKSSEWWLGCVSELNLCINVIGDFINFCLNMLLVDDGTQPEIDISFGEEKERDLVGGKVAYTVSDMDNSNENGKSLGTDCTNNSTLMKQRSQLVHTRCVVNFFAEVHATGLFELQHLNRPLLRCLLKGESQEVAFSLRQLFIASAAILKLKFSFSSARVLKPHLGYSYSGPTSMVTLIGASHFVLLELSEIVARPHSFSFVWLDGILRYLEVLGSHFSLADPVLSRDTYTKLVDIHLRAIGKCISLQGKKATLACHETESSTKTLQAQLGSSDNDANVPALSHGQYSLNEFKTRLRTSFIMFIRKPLELHLLSAVQALERALVGVREGCNMIYCIDTGSLNGGKVSSIVAAAIECLHLVLEYISGRKRMSVVKRHIPNLISALFNIVLHLQSPLIFYQGKLIYDQSEADPDPGSVILMCVEVLTKVAGKNSLFQMDSYHVGQSFHIPAALFQYLLQLRPSQNVLHLFPANRELEPVVDHQFSVGLYAACCKLLCTVLRHRKSESGKCINLLEDSVSILLYCLETLDVDLVTKKGYFDWEVREGIKCASFLRRIYEEIRQQKEILGRYSSHFLSNYIWIYSGYGPHKTGIKREIDEALRPGVYALIDACSPADLQQLHTVLGEGPCRNTLATLQRDYRLNFQYEGKI